MSSVSGSTDCSFDEGLCGWSQDETDEFDWTRTNGDGNSSIGDHTTGGWFFRLGGSKISLLLKWRISSGLKGASATK